MHTQFARAVLVMVGVAAVMQPAEAADAPSRYDYRILATSRTSTMEKEMNEAADAGYQFMGVMGGETGFGGKEAVVVMGKDLSGTTASRMKYRLLATTRTSTMQKEMQEAGDQGFEYLSQTVFQSSFGGREVCVILHRDTEKAITRFEYRLLATSRTSTMQKELQDAGTQGFEYVGMAVGKTALGGNEVVCFLRKVVGAAKAESAHLR